MSITFDQISKYCTRCAWSDDTDDDHHYYIPNEFEIKLQRTKDDCITVFEIIRKKSGEVKMGNFDDFYDLPKLARQGYKVVVYRCTVEDEIKL